MPERSTVRRASGIRTPVPIRPRPRLAALSWLALALLAVALPVGADLSSLPQRLHQDEPMPPLSGLVGTGIGDVVWSGRYLWVATERGLARWDPARGDGLSPIHWVTYTEDNGLGRGAVSALDAVGDTVWAATLFDSTRADLDRPPQVGSGLSFSTNGGATWGHIANEAIFDTLVPGFELGPPTAVNNACFGLSIDGDTIWAAFFAGSTVRSRDHGRTWERVLPDGAPSIVFHVADTSADSLWLMADSLEQAGGDPARIAELVTAADSVASQAYLHRTFAVEAYGDTIWIGTAGGITRSLDGGQAFSTTKVRFDANGRIAPGNISANWVVAIQRQIEPNGSSVVWAGTKVADGPGQVDGLSRTRDHGETWTFNWPGNTPAFAWDFGFAPEAVWAAAERGLFTSADGGATWDSVAVVDAAAGEYLRGAFVGVETVPLEDGTAALWVGADNGLARSLDGGATWRILSFPIRTPSVVDDKTIGEGGLIDSSVHTYAAPNPFAPSRDERCRIVYSLSRDAEVTIELFDFSSRRVRVVLDGEARPGQENHREGWDGTDDDGDQVANGVYFYRLETDRGDRAFGKLVVLD